MSRIDAADRLILALDVPSIEEAEKLLDRIGDSIRIIKVGLELYTTAGPRALDAVRSRGQRLFLDLKFLDIDETVRRATARAAEMGVDFLTVHAHRKALRAAVEARDKSKLPGLKLLAVTVLTNTNDGDLKEMGMQQGVAQLVVTRAGLAAEMGCDGVVASGEEPALIRKDVGEKLIIVTPGIRPTGKDRHDHARATTPTQAIAAGSDYLVVGRPIRDDADPRTAAGAIITEMQAAFDARTS